jgi:membrane-bound lytic murein transglycosylase A
LLTACSGGILVNSTAMSKPMLEPVSFGSIPGWMQDELGEAFSALARSCSEIIARGRGFSRRILFGGQRSDWTALCADALSFAPSPSRQQAREFFETHFRAFQVRDAARPRGLFTGYFEPEVPGDRHRHGEFSVPIYAKPRDLLHFDAETEARLGLRYGRLHDGEPRPYFSRREIEEGALSGKGLEIVWLKSWADAFFIHVQGSGRVRLPDGSVLRLAYAAKSGLPYTAIGGVLVERGELDRDAMSMQAIRDWMQQNANRARQLMWENKSFVFFREVKPADTSLGPPGAQQVQLTPWRSLAIDRDIWAFGTPIWIETQLPSRAQNSDGALRRLMIAQDTGSAIKGTARGDIFFGHGEQAARLAGHLKGEGRMIALLPVGLARKLHGETAP